LNAGSVLQFPVRTIPTEHLFELRNVIREKVVEENSLLPIHRAFVWHHISVFVAHRTGWPKTEKRKDGNECFALFALELFKLHHLRLFAREEFEEALELPGIKTPIDVSKTARFGWRRAGDAHLLFS